jgi:hypothetical protein
MITADGWNGDQGNLEPILNGQQGSTFTQLIDEMWEDMHGMSSIQEEVIQSWINEGIQRLGEKGVLDGHFALSLRSGLDVYPITDGTAITALTESDTGLPYARVTLADSVIGSPYTPVWIEDTNVVDGFCYAMNDPASPTGKVALLAYPFSNITAAVIGSGNMVITVDTALAVSVGTWIAVVLDGTNVAGLYQVASVIDANDYEITGSFSFTFTTGRAFLARTDDITSYIGGGRLWRGDEIPSYVSEFKKSRRIWSSIINTLDPVPLDNMVNAEYIDTRSFKIYTDYTAPSLVAIGTEGGQKYARFYPAPISDSIAEMYCTTIYSASLYNYLPLAHIVKIGRGYEDAVKEYCFYRYYKQAKDQQEALEHWNMFLALSTLRESVLPGKVKMNVTFK